MACEFNPNLIPWQQHLPATAHMLPKHCQLPQPPCASPHAMRMHHNPGTPALKNVEH